MTQPAPPVYLARSTYRQRRFRDAARVLPVAGALLWILPLMASDPATTGRSGLYIFTVWIGLIVVSGIISHRLRREDTTGPNAPPKT